MEPRVRHWFNRRTYSGTQWSATDLMGSKRERISVVIPAHNEAQTIGAIVTAIQGNLMHPLPLVDELVVMNDRSEDCTESVATAAGAVVVDVDSVLPHWGRLVGKGEVLWKSLHVTTGSIVVFVDGDLRDFSSQAVVGLLGPLLNDPSVHLVKATYDRALAAASGLAPTGGGRVTELMARPLLNALWPELTGIIQPLAGEYAARRWALERVPFVSGYGVEIGLLIDLADLVGLDGMAQTDLGCRVHRNQPDNALSRMAAEVLHAALTRTQHVSVSQLSALFTQFGRMAGRYVPVETAVPASERPPMITVPEYQTRYAVTEPERPKEVSVVTD